MDEEIVARIRTAFKELREEIANLEKRVYDLENKVSAHGTLLVDLRGKDAVEFHESFESHEKV